MYTTYFSRRWFAFSAALVLVSVFGFPAAAQQQFIRGDCDGDGIVSGIVTDAVYQLTFSFLAGPAPECNRACDSNGDGVIAGDVADAVHTLTFNFLSGLPPVPPMPSTL